MCIILRLRIEPTHSWYGLLVSYYIHYCYYIDTFICGQWTNCNLVEWLLSRPVFTTILCARLVGENKINEKNYYCKKSLYNTTQRWLTARHRREEHAVNVSRRRFTVNGNEFARYVWRSVLTLNCGLCPTWKQRKKTQGKRTDGQKKRFVFKRDAEKTAAARPKTKTARPSQKFRHCANWSSRVQRRFLSFSINIKKQPRNTRSANTPVASRTGCPIDLHVL